MKITRSVFGVLNRKSVATMPRTSKSQLSIDDRLEKNVDKARAAARERFQHFAGLVDEESGPVDPDKTSMTDDELARLRPAYEVCPQVVAMSLRRAGRPKQAVTKKAVSIRLDPDVIDALRADGAGWQTRANELLRSALRLDT